MPAGTMPTGGHADGTLRRRRRSALACRKCHLRKVRCNVAVSGPPCLNCQDDGASCQVYPRKKLGPKRKSDVLLIDNRVSVEGPNSPNQPPAPSILQLSGPERLQQYQSLSQDHDPASSLAKEAALPTDALPAAEDEAHDARRYALDLDTNPPFEGQKTAPIYVGDQQGLGRFIFDLCNGPAHTGSHYLVPRVSQRTQKTEDLAYLRLKGAFSILSHDVCEDLIRCYFHHVHPFLPIIDAKQFLEEFERHGCRDINLLLIWSMFLATSNFVEQEVLQKAGYATRKAMKRAMYQRAKCLYDSDYEEDKTSLIQSVVLMTFWYSDTEDRTGAWHWMGIAISLCHTLGLHRNPDFSNFKARLPKYRISIWRRIWWSCFANDRWLSLTMGRPMRINPLDCETPMPCIADVTQELLSLPSWISHKYLPTDPERLARLWINSLKISQSLGTIIRAFYTSKDPSPGREEMEVCESELSAIAPRVGEKQETDMISLFHAYQLQLYYETTVIVLHRPNVFRGSSRSVPMKEDSWHAVSRQKAKIAATNINKALEELIELDMIKFLKPMSIPGLTAAMQIHLSEYTSPAPLARRLGRHKLEFLMMVLAELRGTYWGANFWYGLFERALAKLSDDKIRASTIPSINGGSIAKYPVTSTPTSTADIQSGPAVVVDDRIPSLEGFLDPHLFMWDSDSVMTSLLQENESMPPPSSSLIRKEHGPNRTPQNLVNSVVYDDIGLNSLLSFEEFNTHCLDMAQAD